MESDATMTGLMALTVVFLALSAGHVILRPSKGKGQDGRMPAGAGSHDQTATSHSGDVLEEQLTQGSTLTIVPSLLGPDASETYAKHQDSVPASVLTDSLFAGAERGAARDNHP